MLVSGPACAGGCTSGHAVSGIARLSKRSLVATSIFFMVGVITATVFDTAGAMNVVLMDSGIRTFTFDFFLIECLRTQILSFRGLRR